MSHCGASMLQYQVSVALQGSGSYTASLINSKAIVLACMSGLPRHLYIGT